MDKVTQQNAANAEESASASEEMSAQALQMKESVDELIRLVGGADNNENKIKVIKNSHIAHQPIYHSAFQNKPQPVSKKITPREVVPMADEDFIDF